MKKIYLFIASFILLSANSFAQSSCIPNTLSLSAVARDVNGTPVTSTIDVMVELFIGDPATSTNEIYCEQIQNVQPNNFGEFSLEFGPAVFLCNPFVNFDNMDWSQCDIWYKLSWRQTGNPTYTEIASNNFSSVPFAFASRTAEELKGFNTSGAQNGNVMVYNSSLQEWLPGTVAGGTSTISAGSGVSVSTSGGNTTITNTGDLSSTNELQTLSLSGNTLSISSGNSVSLPTSGSSQWTTSGSHIHYSSGRVGIGVDPSTLPSSSNFRFHVKQVANTNLDVAHEVSGNGDLWNVIHFLSSRYVNQAPYTNSSAPFTIGVHQYSTPSDNDAFYIGRAGLATNDLIVFNRIGNVGIGTDVPKSRLQVAGGDINVEQIGSGVILKSPNGNCWRVTVDNSGNFVSTAITCP